MRPEPDQGGSRWGARAERKRTAAQQVLWVNTGDLVLLLSGAER